MHVPSAAFAGVHARTKEAAAEEEVPVVTALNQPARKMKKGRKEKKREGKSGGGKASLVDAEEVLAVQQGASGAANQTGTRNQTYAAVARGNAPPRDFAYPRTNAQSNVNTSNTAAQQTYNASREAGNRRAEGRDKRYQNRAAKPDQTRKENWRRGEGNPRSQFVGPCFACHSVEHRASDSPYVLCYWCRERGHVVRDCPQQAN